jgi:hypothetical protein
MQGGLSDLERAAEKSESLSAKALRVWIEFAEEPRPKAGDADAEDPDVSAVLDEFGGDVRAAIRALLHDLAVLAGDFTKAVSRGTVRGGSSEGGRRLAAGQGLRSEDARPEER